MRRTLRERARIIEALGTGSGLHFLRREWAMPALAAGLTVIVLFLCWEIVIRSLAPAPAVIDRLHLARGISTSLLVALVVARVLWRANRRRSATLEGEVLRRTREGEEATTLLQTIVDSTPAGLLVLDEHLRIRRVNRTAERVNGGALLGRYCFDVLGDSIECNNCPAIKTLRTGEACASRHDHTDRRTGEVFEIEHHPIQFPGGDRGVVLVERVVTQERRALAALRDSEKRYRALYENTPMMYFTLDVYGTVLSVNSNGARELGYGVEELIGRPALDVLHEEDRDTVWAHLKSLIQDHERVGRWEARKRRKDGSVLSVAETVRAIQGDDGRMVLLVICEDITERKLSEKRLREYQEALRAYSLNLALAEERERRRIAIGLHDQVGQALALAKFHLRRIEQSREQAGREPAVDTVQELLDRTIIACRSLTFDLSSPVLYELGLEAALQSLGQQLEESSSVHFHFTSDNKPKPIPEELAILLHRSARELLRNIATHSQAKDAHMSVTRSVDTIQLLISDDGVGIHSPHPGQPSRNGGFGMFSIAEQLRNVGGNLEISSADGHGTRVVITAPLKGARLRKRGANRRADVIVAEER
jgi:PAS domain S-box-containing protein